MQREKSIFYVEIEEHLTVDTSKLKLFVMGPIVQKQGSMKLGI